MTAQSTNLPSTKIPNSLATLAFVQSAHNLLPSAVNGITMDHCSPTDFAFAIVADRDSICRKLRISAFVVYRSFPCGVLIGSVCTPSLISLIGFKAIYLSLGDAFMSLTVGLHPDNVNSTSVTIIEQAQLISFSFLTNGKFSEVSSMQTVGSLPTPRYCLEGCALFSSDG